MTRLEQWALLRLPNGFCIDYMNFRSSLAEWCLVPVWLGIIAAVYLMRTLGIKLQYPNE